MLVTCLPGYKICGSSRGNFQAECQLDSCVSVAVRSPLPFPAGQLLTLTLVCGASTWSWTSWLGSPAAWQSLCSGSQWLLDSNSFIGSAGECSLGIAVWKHLFTGGTCSPLASAAQPAISCGLGVTGTSSRAVMVLQGHAWILHGRTVDQTLDIRSARQVLSATKPSLGPLTLFNIYRYSVFPLY